ncbi:MAG: sensor histidine kinase [Gemmatimonadaceae bacterium]
MKRVAFRPWSTLRGRFLLVIVLGMGLPIMLLGPWLARTARDSGEALLRDRLDASLTEAANGVGNRWIGHRSLLLRMTEDPALLASLRGGDASRGWQDSSSDSGFRQGWAALDGIADAAVVRDTHGAVRALVNRAGEASRGDAAPGTPALPVRLPIYDPVDGARLGTLEARVRLSALLPAALWWSSVGGSVLALFDEHGNAPLLPLSMRPELFASDQFDWAGDRWIVVRRQLQEPTLRFAIAAPLAPIAEPFARAARRAGLALVLVLLAGLVLSALLTRRVTGPLERMSVAADEVAHGRFDQKVGEQGPVELRRLGRAFDTMTESLRATLQKLSQREAVAAVGEFAASLAHEVRNPLTSIRLDLERARERLEDPRRAEELIGRALVEIDRLDAAVGGSLRIARSGSLTLSEIDVRLPLRAALHAARPAFAAHAAHLDVVDSPEGHLVVRGNAGALEQLFLNLLLNAAEAVPPGGRARVVVQPRPDGVCISVEDDGPGILPELLGRVREPFYTTKEHGTGLGLSIAQRISDAHGAELRLQSVAGSGTSALVILAREHAPTAAAFP